ncbi:HTH-type dhaKLM operon transcriptional activator DhaS [compost metagenome]
MPNSLLTKKALAECLKKRMEHTPLSKITIKQITDDCGVNRQTFYYHFHDLFELLGWIYKKEAVGSISAYRSYDTWTDGFCRIFLYIQNNRAFCCNTLESLGRNHLDAYLYAVTNELIMGVIDELAANMNVSVQDKQFIANFYTLAFSGLVIKWMRDGMRENPQAMIERLSVLLEGQFLTALSKYEHTSF